MIDRLLSDWPLALAAVLLLFVACVGLEGDREELEEERGDGEGPVD